MGETGKMASLHSLGLVLVEFEYEYEGRDGHMVSIKPNERYILLAKTNDHWWHVCKDERAKPFYIPANYVKELPPNIPSPLDFREAPAPDVKLAVPDLTEIRKPDEVTIKLRSKGNYHKTENRMSTFGVPLDLHEPPSYKHGGPSDSLLSLNTVSASDSSQQKKRMSQATNLLFGSRGAPAETAPDKFRVPSFNPADPIQRPIPAKPVELPVVKNLNETRPHRKSPELESPIEPESESSGSEPLPSPDSENIYESISDLNLDLLSLTDKAPAGLPNPQTNTSCSPPTIKTENDPTTAVYANVTDLKKTIPRSSNSSVSTCSSPGIALSPAPDSTSPPNSAGWQVHTDQDSGQEYYYHPATGQSSWSDPRSPHPGAGMESATSPRPASTSSSAHSLGSDWEQLLDETTGRHYYYNQALKQTSWTAPEQSPPPSSMEGAHSLGKELDEPPPLPDEDYPKNQLEGSHTSFQLPKDLNLHQIKRAIIPRAVMDTHKDVPLGWTHSVGADGKNIYTSELTHEQWIQSKDDKGKLFYYSKDESRCLWTLPEASVLPGQPMNGNGIEQNAQPVLNNWRFTIAVSQEDLKFSPSHRRIASDNASDASSTGNSPESQHYDKKLRRRRNLSSQSTDSHSHHSSLEKAGILNKTKVAENGKRLRKNWAQSWTVLHDGILTFHKDPKFTPAGMSTKSNQIVPEYTVELKGATLSWASKEKSSKKNVLELKTRHGSEYLIQYDTDSIIHDWHKIILDTIRLLHDHGHYSEDEVEEIPEKNPLPADKEKKTESTRLSSTSSIDIEQGRVRTKLRKFLQRRPTLQAVKEKGYIKENVFGCHLDTLYHRENTTVPKFMEKCIRSVEKRGLKIDGIYRVSGNLAVIQKLRYKADHEDELDLEDGQWEEIHVITGALKLFLRELPEPLFPFSFFERFIAAIQMSDYSQKVSYIRDLVRNLPLPNHDTMEVLFRHLRKVIEHGELNRMSVQSMAIVFGPTLLRPQEESNITMHMVFQNQIVELILNEYSELFHNK
ncbi:rho GTPase-activating protein 27 isoform X2 [Pseudorasbora parva]|uniref:rho GTPase-activating protein 27 isoform X2 n=1 Tax=Pseudorasbora parva TaxID=51549 RepID=UPI00351F47D5